MQKNQLIRTLQRHVRGPSLYRASSQAVRTAHVDFMARAIISTSTVTDNKILTTRPVERAGAHARGQQRPLIGIAYEGGFNDHGNPKDTRTEWQRHSLRVLVRALLMDYPEAKVAARSPP